MIDQYITLTEDSAYVNFPNGKTVLPIDFGYDFGNRNVFIKGGDKTVLTSYNGNADTNFAIVPKIPVATSSYPDGVYLEEMTGFYFKIEGGFFGRIFFAEVKAMGYVTELNTAANSEPLVDGLYVVTEHPYISYGGGMAHLNLRNNWNTNNADCFYVQGTVLKRSNAVWSRHYTGYGFMTKGDLVCKSVTFDNCQFYCLSPFDAEGKQYTTSQVFDVSECTFNNVARVVSSVNYAGVNQQPNWYNNLQYYSTNGRFRFKNFLIKNNKFSYIHSWILCGFPPSEYAQIDGNTITDCYTIFCCFNFFVKNYANANYCIDKTIQVVSNNMFVNVRPPNNNWQTALIRTSGMASVYGNQFINCSPQIVFLSGGNSAVSNNIISKWNDGKELLSPVFLIKMSTGVNVISKNVITAPMSSLVYLEGSSNTVITDNVIIGCTRYRNITTASVGISRDMVYQVINLQKFKDLAIDYDTDIVQGNHVFYDKIKGVWRKTIINIIGVVFSKNDSTPLTNSQYVVIKGNSADIEGFTNIGGVNTFKRVSVTANDVSNAVYLHTGNTAIVDYFFTENRISSALPTPTASITNFINKDNIVCP